MAEAVNKKLMDDFFSTMLDRVLNGDLTWLGQHHYLPSVFKFDGENHVCMQPSEVEIQLKTLIESSKVKIARNITYTMIQCVSLTERIVFARIKWRWLDTHGQDIAWRYASYTLSNGSTTPQIMISVIDDRKQDAEV
jgi:hypothetical protein